MYSIQRTFTFCAAHRIEGHPKCGRLHGHNYLVTVFLMDSKLDNQGMVLDFGDLDREVKPLIDELDHRYLISEANIDMGDPYAAIASKNGDGVFLDCKHSTAEALAAMFHSRIVTKLGCSPEELTVEVEETSRNSAIYTE